MSRKKLMTIQTRDGFPRVSGDEPASIGAGERRALFSPRERG